MIRIFVTLNYLNIFFLTIISLCSAQLIGNLKPDNNYLADAKYIGQKILKGPESIVFDKDGNMYTGLTSGKIVKIDKNNTTNIKNLVQTGEETDENICSLHFFCFEIMFLI